jgi:hypothetical protein
MKLSTANQMKDQSQLSLKNELLLRKLQIQGIRLISRAEI